MPEGDVSRRQIVWLCSCRDRNGGDSHLCHCHSPQRVAHAECKLYEYVDGKRRLVEREFPR